MRGVWALIFILFICADRVAIAQEAVEIEAPQLSASGLDYLKAVRFRGIDTDVRYFDPAGPAPELDTDAAPEPERRDRGFTFDIGEQWNVVMIALLAILVLAILISLGRVGTSVSFRKAAKNARRRATDGAEEDAPEEQLPPDLDAILRQPDRQKALVRLSQFVLTRCLNANGILFKRSWTQREALRKLPKSLPHLSDLRALVLDSERVSFGRRKVSDSEFQAHISRIRPLLRGMSR